MVKKTVAFTAVQLEYLTVLIEEEMQAVESAGPTRIYEKRVLKDIFKKLKDVAAASQETSPA